MWKAEKIELTKNSDEEENSHNFYLRDCFTLKINDEFICNSITNEPLTGWSFETCICTECGEESCNGAPFLMIRKFNGGLLFLPAWDYLSSFEEYDHDTCEGDRSCAPHKWYEDGILVVEEKMMPEFLRIIPSSNLEKIPEISKEYLDLMDKWEGLVIENPEKGFMNKSENKKIEMAARIEDTDK